MPIAGVFVASLAIKYIAILIKNQRINRWFFHFTLPPARYFAKAAMNHGALSCATLSAHLIW